MRKLQALHSASSELITSQQTVPEQLLVGAHLGKLLVAFSPDGLELALHDIFDFGHQNDVDALAGRDAAHPVRALRVVAEVHVLAQREHRHRVGHVLDVVPVVCTWS